MSILSWLLKPRSKKKLSIVRLKHISEGDWVYPNKNNGYKYRLKSGGHGQRNIDLAIDRQVKFNVTQTYRNGVRTGNYPNHKEKEKRTSPNQTWFPEKWKERDIKKAAEKIANNRKLQTKPNRSKYGNYKGIRVGVFTNYNDITTAFPDKFNQDNKRRR